MEMEHQPPLFSSFCSQLPIFRFFLLLMALYLMYPIRQEPMWGKGGGQESGRLQAAILRLSIHLSSNQTFHHRLLAGRVHARRESIEEEEEEEEMEEEEVVVEAERDSGLGSEDSQAGSNERLLPPMEPSARYSLEPLLTFVPI